MMKRLIVFVLSGLIAVTIPVYAQPSGGVVAIPPITPGDLACWKAINILQDAVTGGCTGGGGSGTVTTITAGTNITLSSGATCTTTCTINASGSGTGANPTATAGPTAVNGSATTFLRSDGAPAIQKASNSQFGIMEGDGLTVGCTSTAGVCNTLSQVIAGTTQNITAAQWAPCSEFDVKTASQTLTLPLASTLSSTGCAFIKTIGQSVILAPNAADAINGGTTGASVTISAGVLASVTVDPASANSILVSPTSGSGSGTVNSGTSGQLAYYGSTGTAVSGTNAGTGVITALGNALSAAGGVTSTIASGTSALGTSAISSGTCATVVTTSAPNVATTDVITAGFNGDPTGVTGYAPATTGMLTIIGYPSSGNVNWKVCNNTSASITPGAITLNWRVVR